MTSHWETGTHTMFSTIATPSNYPQMLTSQNVGSPHLFVGGRSHYNKPVLNPSIKHCLARFIAACWAFTTSIPDCCKSLNVRLNDSSQWNFPNRCWLWATVFRLQTLLHVESLNIKLSQTLFFLCTLFQFIIIIIINKMIRGWNTALWQCVFK